MLRRLLKAMGVATALALAAPGCGGGDSEKKPAQVANEKSATPRVTTSKPAPALDACKLLTQAEVQPYLGVTEAGRPAAGVGESVCEWRNASTEESVTLSIGSSRTAVNGLDPTSPYGETEPVSGLGGSARYSPGAGVIEFVAGDRACEIQVAILDHDKQPGAAVSLARLVLDRI